MALVICPEEHCGRKGISTTATSCPSCGADIQGFLASGFTENALAFPIDPMRYWNNWHFFYYQGRSIDEIRPAPEGWVDFGEPLIRFRDIEVPSPISGLVVRSAVELHPAIDVGYSSKCETFIVVRLDKRSVHKEGKEMELFEIGHIFRSFYDEMRSRRSRMGRFGEC